MFDFISRIWFVLQKRHFAILFLILVPFFFAMFVFLPVLTIKFNTIAFQLSTYNIYDYILLSTLSLVSALLVTMQIYAYKYPAKICSQTFPFLTTLGAGTSGVLASIIGTATCASCIAPIVALFGLGFNGIVFVLKYRTELSIISIIIMLLAIYLLAKSINYQTNKS